MFLCKRCDKDYENLKSLAMHYVASHSLSSKEMYVEVKLNGIIPLCKCGCGKETKYLDTGRGFRDYIKGHSIRMNNPCNFRTEETWKKIGKTRKEKFANGETKVWSEGLTKETDIRLKLYGDKGSKTIKLNKKEIERRSKLMKENRLNGTIPTLHGDKHSQWNGGTSSLQNYCRSNKRLYSEWKYPILLNAKFACEKCSKLSTESVLHVHHNKESYADILRLIAKKFNWNQHYTIKVENYCDTEVNKLVSNISEAVVDYHIQNKVSGIVLCEECHKKEHNKLNF